MANAKNFKRKERFTIKGYGNRIFIKLNDVDTEHGTLSCFRQKSTGKIFYFEQHIEATLKPKKPKKPKV